MSFKVEKDWITAEGYRAVAGMCERSNRGRTGYIALPEGHPLIGVGTSDHADCLIPLWRQRMEEPLGELGIIPVMCSGMNPYVARLDCAIRVHGGMTFAKECSDYPVPTPVPTWWVGFSCDHSGDSLETCTLDYVVTQCERMSAQLRTAADIQERLDKELQL